MNIYMLLKRYGTPPPEILRDWAWQLHWHLQRQRTCQHPNAAAPHGDSWLSIVVGPDGQLDLSDTSHSATEGAMRQVQEWLTLQPHRPKPVALELATSDTMADGEALEALEGERVQRPNLSRQLRRSTLCRRQRFLTKLWGSPITVVAGLAALSFLLAGGWLLRSRKPDRTGTPTVAAEVAAELAAEVVASVEPVAKPTAAMEGESEIEVISFNEPITAIGLEELGAKAARRASQPLSIRPDLDWNPATTAKSLGSASFDGAVAQETASSQPANVAPQDGHGTSGIADVMREVKQAFEQAENQARSTPTNSPGSSTELSSTPLSDARRPSTAPAPEAVAQPNLPQPNSNQPEPTLITLSRDRVRVSHSLARLQGGEGAPQRARSHDWTLTMQQPTGYRLEPTEPQAVQARQPIQWRLSDEDDASPRACLIVQVVQRSRRSGELEMLFYGSADDLPLLALPLGRKVLDPLLFRLQAARSQLESFLETAAKMRASPENRAQLAEQKKLANEQLHLCHRLIEIIAQCDRLADLIDGQVTIFAQ